MSKKHKKIKDIVAKLKGFPIHPQWLILRQQKSLLESLVTIVDKDSIVLDIGCSDKYLSYLINPSAQYIGVDHYDSASDMYLTRPDVYGDAQLLCIDNEAVDVVYLMDVAEHLPDPELALDEIVRVLKVNGTLVLTIPFLYPIHDAPMDYQRWTEYALHERLGKAGLINIKVDNQGNLITTGCLIVNLGIAKLFADMWGNKNPLVILLPIAVVIVVLSNLLGALATLILGNDATGPFAYSVIAKKA